MSEQLKRFGMGWRPDLPDFRDYTVDTDEVPARVKRAGTEEPVKRLLERAGAVRAERLVEKVDLTQWCSPIEDQSSIGSCTAQAGAGLIEYFERRAFGRHLEASRLFLYKATRNLLGWQGDTGAYLRSTMGAMALFGVPPEEYWPYDIGRYDAEPPAFCYAFGQSFQALNYYRLDSPGTPKADLLRRIKTQLQAGLPSMFGFTVYESINQANRTGRIPYPSRTERILGGHAVVAVGYDDSMVIKNTGPTPRETTGALLIRNSWGTSWGQAGYGYLPYDYVTKSLAVDWWCLLKKEWVDTGTFGAP